VGDWNEFASVTESFRGWPKAEEGVIVLILGVVNSSKAANDLFLLDPSDIPFAGLLGCTETSFSKERKPVVGAKIVGPVGKTGSL